MDENPSLSQSEVLHMADGDWRQSKVALNTGSDSRKWFCNLQVHSEMLSFQGKLFHAEAVDLCEL